MRVCEVRYTCDITSKWIQYLNICHYSYLLFREVIVPEFGYIILTLGIFIIPYCILSISRNKPHDINDIWILLKLNWLNSINPLISCPTCYISCFNPNKRIILKWWSINPRCVHISWVAWLLSFYVVVLYYLGAFK